MKTKLLKTFQAVAIKKSFSAAAKSLNTVQPAVSQQIVDLEDYLGVSLFWRTTREVKLTPAGELLLNEVTALLESLSRTEQRVKQAAKGQIGTLRIGYLESASYKFLPGVINQFTETYPEVQVHLDIMTVQEQIDAFKKDVIDIGLSRPLPKTEKLNLTSQFIYDDHLAVFLPPNHELANRSSLTLDELEGESFILFSRIGAKKLFDTIITACGNVGFSPSITHESNAMQTVLTLVECGLGISVAPSCIRHLNSEGCICIPLKSVTEGVALEVHYKTKPEQKAVQNFVELLLKNRLRVAAQMVSPLPA